MGRFNEIAAHVHDSPTSVAAAVSVSHMRGRMHAKIVDYLRNHPEGGTDEQIQIALDMKQNTERPRRIELVEAGTVKDSGRKSKTISKRSAVVWVLCVT